MILKERVKENSTVVKWGMYFNQGKGSCRKADRCTFSHDPKVAVYVPKEKVRESAEVLIRLGPLRPPGAIPPEVVRPLEDRARDVLLILRSIRLSLAVTSQGAPVPLEIGVRLSFTTYIVEGRPR